MHTASFGYVQFPMGWVRQNKRALLSCSHFLSPRLVVLPWAMEEKMFSSGSASPRFPTEHMAEESSQPPESEHFAYSKAPVINLVLRSRISLTIDGNRLSLAWPAIEPTLRCSTRQNSLS